MSPGGSQDSRDSRSTSARKTRATGAFTMRDARSVLGIARRYLSPHSSGLADVAGAGPLVPRARRLVHEAPGPRRATCSTSGPAPGLRNEEGPGAVAPGPPHRTEIRLAVGE